MAMSDELPGCDNCGRKIQVPSDHEQFCPLKGSYDSPPATLGDSDE